MCQYTKDCSYLAKKPYQFNLELVSNEGGKKMNIELRVHLFIFIGLPLICFGLPVLAEHDDKTFLYQNSMIGDPSTGDFEIFYIDTDGMNPITTNFQDVIDSGFAYEDLKIWFNDFHYPNNRDIIKFVNNFSSGYYELYDYDPVTFKVFSLDMDMVKSELFEIGTLGYYGKKVFFTHDMLDYTEVHGAQIENYLLKGKFAKLAKYYYEYDGDYKIKGVVDSKLLTDGIVGSDLIAWDDTVPEPLPAPMFGGMLIPLIGIIVGFRRFVQRFI